MHDCLHTLKINKHYMTCIFLFVDVLLMCLVPVKVKMMLLEMTAVSRVISVGHVIHIL